MAFATGGPERNVGQTGAGSGTAGLRGGGPGGLVIIPKPIPAGANPGAIPGPGDMAFRR